MKIFFAILSFLFCVSTHARSNDNAEVGGTLNSTNEGLKIVSIEKGSVFKKLGLQVNDTLIAIDGKKIQKFEDFQTVATHLKSKQNVKLTLIRNGKVETFTYEFK